MTSIKRTAFSGIRPRVPESLLPANCATVAENCDFAYGELRSTKAGYLVATMENAPRSIYTDDGLVFYTWPTDVDAVRSPLVRDTYDRLYYTGDGFRVTSRSGQKPSGGVPASSYLVGVPAPAVAPVLSIPGLSALANATPDIHLPL